MNSHQLNKVMRLIRRTGDRCVVLDNENDDAVVLMNLDEYEMMLGEDACTCDCCDDQKWVEDTDEEEDLLEDLPIELDDDFVPKAEAVSAQWPEDIEAELETKIDAQNPMESVVDLPATEPKNFANIGQEESITDLPSEEADRFYLEPVDE